MNTNRLLIFVTVLAVMFFALRNCWHSKPASEQWLFFNESAARDYAGQVLGPGRGAKVPIPKPLTGTVITTHATYVTFSPENNSQLVLAFSPDAKPPAPKDPASAGQDWLPLGNSWYQLTVIPAGGQ